MDETAVLQKASVASCLWDMAKFYDSIDWRVLAVQAPKHGYPIRVLAIGMIVHTSPRMLKNRHAVSLPCQAFTGSMAGDTQANAFAKCVLYDVLTYIHGKWPGAGPFSYVDDLAQTTRGYESGILQTLVQQESAWLKCWKKQDALYHPNLSWWQAMPSLDKDL